MTLEIEQIEVGLLQNFCEVIGCSQTGKAALVDPAFEVDRLLRVASERGWSVETILLTHTHDDHIAGLDEAAAATGAQVWCHPSEVETARQQASRVHAVEDSAWIDIGQGRVQAIYTPGHTPGCVCWYLPDPGALITGDVLFVGSSGGASNVSDMVDSLQRRIGGLPEETRLYPGHDYGKTPTSTLAWEFGNNPALLADSVEAFEDYKSGKRRRG